MIIYESQKKARNNWDKKNMMVFHCKVKKEQGELFKQYAAEQGKSINEILKEFISKCIENDVEK